MATAINRAMNEIKLETNVAQTFALKYATGKPVGQWGNVMFTAVDDRRLFLNQEDAGEFEHALTDLRYQPCDFIRVTRVKHGTARGGGFSVRVEFAEETRLEADLRKSIVAAKAASPVERAVTLGNAAAPATPEDYSNTGNGIPSAAHPQAGPLSPTAVRFMGAYKDAVDIMIQTQGYAKSQGLLLNVECADVRCLAATIMIGSQGGGR